MLDNNNLKQHGIPKRKKSDELLRPFSVVEKILINNQWQLHHSLLHRLDCDEHYYCSLETLKKHMEIDPDEPWKYIFFCDRTDRGFPSKYAGENVFNCNFFFCSGEYLFKYPNESVMMNFILRINSENKIYSCLIRIVENKLVDDSKNLHPKWREFPICK